jgi:hypothetical protein
LGVLSPTSEAAPHVGTPPEKVATFFKLYAWPFSNLLSLVERLGDFERFVPGKLLNFPDAEHSWLRHASAWIEAHPAAIVIFDVVFAVFVVTPTLVLAIAAWRGRVRWSAAYGALGLAAFVFCMLGATATARADQTTVAGRYLDHVALAGYVSIVACGLLVVSLPAWRKWAAIWGGVLAAGYGATMVAATAQMSRRRPEAYRQTLQRYFETRDPAVMRVDNAFKNFITGSDPTAFLAQLDAPDMQPIIPPTIAKPDQPLPWPGKVARRFGQIGAWIAIFAAGAAAWVVATERRRTSRLGSAAPLPAPIRLGGV